jgi:hypothetical protein
MTDFRTFVRPGHLYSPLSAWDEARFMRPFLMLNAGFSIEYFNHCVARVAFDRAIPAFVPNLGGSLWMRRIG